MFFRDLNLNPIILEALQAKGYEKPTPIQAGAIPPLLEGRDVWGCAQTGTGKTAAFALPILNNLAAKPFTKTGAVRALILSPTRELAVQIDEQIRLYGKGLRLRSCVIFGGVSEVPQKQKLRQGVEIVVATPGRLMDLLNQKALSLSHVEVFTLDEADRMLDMGFIHDVRRISALLPEKRQTLLFSATMPPEIRSLAKNLLRDPVNVEVNPVSSTAAKIEQSVYHVSRNLKPALLKELLLDDAIVRALVFTRTKHGADKVVRALDKSGVFAEAIHGNKAQNARQRALNNFKSGQTRVLVATDIASRGIDVQEISHVFNYDLPEVAESYVHRIGRTGRNGASGVAVAFCDGEERNYLRAIERTTRQQLPVRETPRDLQPIPAGDPTPRDERDARGQGRPQRPRPEGRFDAQRREARQGDARGPRQQSGEYRGPREGFGGPAERSGDREGAARPKTYSNPAAERGRSSFRGNGAAHGHQGAPRTPGRSGEGQGQGGQGRAPEGRGEYVPFWKRRVAQSDRRRPSQESTR
jgi:ATP-dependent RNA helicase RhlE